MKKYTAQEKYRKILKEEVINHYGGKCVRCGCIDIRYLTIDHINGLSKNEPKNARAGYALYLRIRREKFPDTFQVLCFHCNFRKQ